MPTDEIRMKLWSIGGGKGGIGKSLITLGLGVALARLGKRVILVDGDLGGANLHTLMGVRYPHVNLEHFLTNKVARLEDTIIESPIEGIGLICGADDLLGAANPNYAEKIRLLNQIEELPAQYVLMDLGAGTSFNTLDFFNYSWGKIALFTSQATSLENAYGFIKSALYRKLSREFAGDDEFFHLIYQGGGAGGGKSILKYEGTGPAGPGVAGFPSVPGAQYGPEQWRPEICRNYQFNVPGFLEYRARNYGVRPL